MSCGPVLGLLGVVGVFRSAVTWLLWNAALYLLPPRGDGKWELSCGGFGVIVARIKSGFFGLLGSNLLESCLLVSWGTSVSVGMSPLSCYVGSVGVIEHDVFFIVSFTRELGVVLCCCACIYFVFDCYEHDYFFVGWVIICAENDVIFILVEDLG